MWSLLLTALVGGATADAKAPEAQTPDTVILAYRVGSIPVDGQAKAWRKAGPMEVELSRQRTVPLMDIAANARLDAVGGRSATIRALYTDDAVGIRVTWSDETHNELNLEDEQYGDSIAWSLPTVFGPGEPLPYIGMGDIQHPVVIASKRANRHATQERQFVAAGFGSLQPIDINTQMSMEYDAERKEWTAVFVRPRVDGNVDLREAPVIPFSVAIWDGGDLERGGYKSVMRWHALQLVREEPSVAYLDELRWGEDGRPIGDASHGKELAGTLCIACHRFDDKEMALEGMAPNLSEVGHQAAASYIRDSILDPNKVVVRNPNPNRHYDPNAAREPTGGHPPNALYSWYTKAEDGSYVSKMPRFAHLTESDVNDIVAYFKSLGADGSADAPLPNPEEQP